MKYKKKGKRANMKTVNSVATPSSELPSKEEHLSYIISMTEKRRPPFHREDNCS